MPGIAGAAVDGDRIAGIRRGRRGGLPGRGRPEPRLRQRRRRCVDGRPDPVGQVGQPARVERGAAHRLPPVFFAGALVADFLAGAALAVEVADAALLLAAFAEVVLAGAAFAGASLAVDAALVPSDLAGRALRGGSLADAGPSPAPPVFLAGAAFL